MNKKFKYGSLILAACLISTYAAADEELNDKVRILVDPMKKEPTLQYSIQKPEADVLGTFAFGPNGTPQAGGHLKVGDFKLCPTEAGARVGGNDDGLSVGCRYSSKNGYLAIRAYGGYHVDYTAKMQGLLLGADVAGMAKVGKLQLEGEARRGMISGATGFAMRDSGGTHQQCDSQRRNIYDNYGNIVGHYYEDVNCHQVNNQTEVIAGGMGSFSSVRVGAEYPVNRSVSGYAEYINTKTKVNAVRTLDNSAVPLNSGSNRVNVGLAIKTGSGS